MSHTILLRVTGNEAAQALLAALAAVGIPRTAIDLHDPDQGPPPGGDAVLNRALLGALAGGAVGAVVGYLVTVWWSFPWVGVAWGLGVGVICGARIAGNRAADRAGAGPALRGARVEIRVVDDAQRVLVERICRHQHLGELRVVETPAPVPA